MLVLLFLAAVLVFPASAGAADPAIEDGSALTALNQARERWGRSGTSPWIPTR